MKTLKEYIKIFEDNLSSIQSVGVSAPEHEQPVPDSKKVEVEIDYSQDMNGQPSKDVWARAGGKFISGGTDPDVLRKILNDAGIPIPDSQDFDQENNSGVSVQVSSDGRIAANASGEHADKLLQILDHAGIDLPSNANFSADDEGSEEPVAEATDAEVTEVVRLARELRK